ncbi:hypothetical protein OG625_27490 [Streptomyces sp. NBC_01351]|uniref:hypothetical protein n=1 Tax=Streptomyces sp. NBC_01351 TaxID=2903833 RepID=UPI002E2FB4E9|nr:hypothetical protein [Streptomyces sp. NBC_01351]
MHRYGEQIAMARFVVVTVLGLVFWNWTVQLSSGVTEVAWSKVMGNVLVPAMYPPAMAFCPAGHVAVLVAVPPF